MSKELRTELIEVLEDDGIEITTNKLMKMHNLLSLTESEETTLKEILEKKLNIPKEVVQNITDTMLLNFRMKEFYEYIATRDRIGETLVQILGKKTNIPELFDVQQSIDPELSKWLMKLVWKTQPPSGEGEAALAMLFKNARKPNNTEAGDVIINDALVEVKGRGARIIGQRGYGDGPSVALNIRLRLNQCAQEHCIDIGELPENTLVYNFSKTGSWIIEEIGKKLIQESKGEINSYDIAKIITDSLMILYKDADQQDIFNWVDEAVNEVGVFDKDLFIRNFLEFSFRYYHSIEKFEIFVMVNRDDVLIIKPEDFSKHIGTNIKFGMPSFGQKAGTQGKAFSITLR